MVGLVYGHPRNVRQRTPQNCGWIYYEQTDNYGLQRVLKWSDHRNKTSLSAESTVIRKSGYIRAFVIKLTVAALQPGLHDVNNCANKPFNKKQSKVKSRANCLYSFKSAKALFEDVKCPSQDLSPNTIHSHLKRLLFCYLKEIKLREKSAEMCHAEADIHSLILSSHTLDPLLICRFDRLTLDSVSHLISAGC